MINYVKHIHAVAIHGRIDLEQDFEPGINVLYGKNGSGKTTLLHILTNALNGYYERFAFLKFNSIHISLGDDTSIVIRQEKKDKEITISALHSGANDEPVSFTAAEVRRIEREATIRSGGSSRRVEVPRLPQLVNVGQTLPTAYFPAFRSMIEAWRSLEERRPVSPRDIDFFEGVRKTATYLARELLGEFTPDLTYPSPSDIVVGLSEEYRQATLKVADTTRKLLSQAFLDIFAALSGRSGKIGKNSEVILQEIQALLSKSEAFASEEAIPGANIVTDLRRQLTTFQFPGEKATAAADILEVYQKILKEIVSVQERSFEGITQYIDAVNDFLEGKDLIIKRNNLQPMVRIRFDEDLFGSPQSLSSGERQILTMIYAASRMSSQQVVLIDEPEISLHVDWQELLLKKLAKQIQDRQVIVCTHSPIIGADYDMKELLLTPTHKVSSLGNTDIETEALL